MSRVVTIALLWVFAGVCLAADSATNEAARKAEATECIACHSERLIHSQRLSPAAWGKEVEKMIGWGAVVKDKQMLIDYLAAQYGNSQPSPAPAISADGVRK